MWSHVFFGTRSFSLVNFAVIGCHSNNCIWYFGSLFWIILHYAVHSGMIMGPLFSADFEHTINSFLKKYWPHGFNTKCLSTEAHRFCHTTYVLFKRMKSLLLVWRKGNIKKTVSVLQYCEPYYYNDAQRCEQFLQVGWLYRALILLGLALYLPSASVSSVFMVLYRYYFLLTSFSLPFSELSLARLDTDVVD